MDGMPIVEWVSLPEAAKTLQKSEKTIERLVKAGSIESKLEPRPGRKSERLYRAADIERLAQNGHGSTAVARVPQSAVPAKMAAVQLAPEIMDKFRHVVIDGMSAYASQVPTHLKLWLSLAEAREYSGLSKPTLLQAIRNGKVTAQKSGGWKIKRASLEAL